MIDSWKTLLQSQGAVIEGSTVLHYGDPAAERAAAADGTIVADLSQLGMIAFRGEDTAAFLQGQLTNDVRSLHADSAQWNGYCSPKGRLLGNFLVWRQGEDYCLQLAGDILAGVLKRLSMFILRAKVQGRDASDETVRLVVAGPLAEAAVSAAMGAVPDTAMHSVASEAGQVIRVGADKFVLSVTPERAAAVWQALRQSATPVGAPVWDWLRLNAGIPMIVAATQEQFVPQMVNLEVIGGVSFQKGCYPGRRSSRAASIWASSSAACSSRTSMPKPHPATACTAPIWRDRPLAPWSTGHGRRPAASMCWPSPRSKARTPRPCT